MLPTELFFGQEETADGFATHSASWHKSCNLKYNNTKLSKARKKREANPEPDEQRLRKRQAVDVQLVCIFCEKGCEAGDLRQVLTFEANNNIKRMATELKDSVLVSRITGGDLIAIEAKYHLNCLVNLRNRYRSQLRKQNREPEDLNEKVNESRVFVEVTSYIEKAVNHGTLLFKLSELHTLYLERLKDFGIVKTVNKTRLKDQLLKHFTEAQEQQDGRNTILIFKNGMANMLREALKKRDFSDDAFVLAKAAKIIRDDIFNQQPFHFEGSFHPKCQEDSIPSSLKSFISQVFNGTNLKNQDKQDSQACLTVGQVIVYNTKKRSTQSDVMTRHSLKREPPLPIYIGLNIHTLTRCKKLIQQLYQFGISISYDRVIELEDCIASSVSQQYKAEGVVAPSCLRKGLFTVGALDNIDHNLSSTTASSSCHGTGISLFQFPSNENLGITRSSPGFVDVSKKHYLPDGYAIVPAVSMSTSNVLVPPSDVTPYPSRLNDELVQEAYWKNHVLNVIKDNCDERSDGVAWAAYHASQKQSDDCLPALSALLPLFYEKSSTPAMIKHGMDIQRKAIDYLNPGQIPVPMFDQPLYALAKFVQWKWPLTHGEKTYVVMLGGLHRDGVVENHG